MALASHPSFLSPPLVEVVCGVTFRPIPAFQAPHYGLFWNSIRDQFPKTATVPAIPSAMPLEVLHDVNSEVTVQVTPTMPRVWFISSDDTQLIQLQPDRFLFNWRESSQGGTYPRHEFVLGRFHEMLSLFKSFLLQNSLREIAVLSSELTYVNHIKFGEVIRSFGEMGKVFPDLSWRRNNELLAEPEAFAFQSSHAFAHGNIRVSVQSARAANDQSPLIRFDLTARDETGGLPEDDFWHWYEEANGYLARAFLEFTSEEMQRDVWGRTS